MSRGPRVGARPRRPRARPRLRPALAAAVASASVASASVASAAAVVCAALLVDAAAPAGVAAQVGPDADEGGWPGAKVGVRVGYDNGQRQEVVGALLRIPILRNGSVEILPSGDVTFLRGVREYQLNAEAVYMLSEGGGGIYAGGGVGLRDAVSRSDPSQGRETITTFSVVVGIEFSGLDRIHPFLEFRRIFASELVVDPQLLSLGVSVSLW
jgi:hypothetical protein